MIVLRYRSSETPKHTEPPLTRIQQTFQLCKLLACLPNPNRLHAIVSLYYIPLASCDDGRLKGCFWLRTPLPSQQPPRIPARVTFAHVMERQTGPLHEVRGRKDDQTYRLQTSSLRTTTEDGGDDDDDRAYCSPLIFSLGTDISIRRHRVIDLASVSFFVFLRSYFYSVGVQYVRYSQELIMA